MAKITVWSKGGGVNANLINAVGGQSQTRRKAHSCELALPLPPVCSVQAEPGSMV